MRIRPLALVGVVSACVLSGCGLGSVGYQADQRRADRPSQSGSAPAPSAGQAGDITLGPDTEPAPGLPRVDLAIAEQVLDDYDAANNLANQARSDAAISAIETGAMLEIDLASYAASRALDPLRSYESSPFTTGDPVFVMERTTTYPVRFLVVGSQASAAAGTETDPQASPTTVMQFVRVDSDSSWKLEHVANAVEDVALEVDVDADGYVVDVPPPVDPSGVGPAIVTTLNGSNPGIAFTPGADPEAALGGYLDARELGIGVDLSPTDGQTVSSWPLRPGGLLVLTSFRSEVTFRPAAGQELLQPATRDVFTSLLEPGRYADVRLDWVGLQAWTTTGAGQPLQLAAAYDGAVGAAGERTGDVPEDGEPGIGA